MRQQQLNGLETSVVRTKYTVHLSEMLDRATLASFVLLDRQSLTCSCPCVQIGRGQYATRQRCSAQETDGG